jgi:hypothetical protein
VERPKWDGAGGGEWIEADPAGLELDGPPATPGPECGGCGRPVPWRFVEWRIGLDPVGSRPGLAAVTSEPVRPAWHPDCRRRRAVGEFRAEWVALRRLGEALGPVVAQLAEAVGPVVAAVVPAVAERVGAIGSSGRTVVGLYWSAARRRVRGVRLDRLARPAGERVGAVLVAALDVGARLTRVVEWWLFEFTDRTYHLRRLASKVVWTRELGWTGARRQLLDARWLRRGRFDRAHAPQAAPAPVAVAAMVDGQWRSIGWADAADAARFRHDTEPVFRREHLGRWPAAERLDRDRPGRGHDGRA